MQELYAMLNQDALRVAQGTGWGVRQAHPPDGPRFKVPQEVSLAHCYSERSVKNL
ncbi:hypothetical protein [Sphingobacterium sp.]|uniref:hypothetical protein n=1 Tax=Sphingobacterium sp. TaxID=341027 RepID=UPI0028B04AD1|nr:hypothetical protein [Sphingobacterium sp.]